MSTTNKMATFDPDWRNMALLGKVVLWAGSPGLGRVVNPDAFPRVGPRGGA